MTQVVRFIKPYDVYTEGDVAGVDEVIAKAAFAAEAAVPYENEIRDEEKKEDKNEDKSVSKAVKDKMVKNAEVEK